MQAQLDIYNFFKDRLPSLKENGRGGAMAICPFHPDKNPSLSINLENGLFNCFGCGASGGIFHFYQKYHNTDFKTALKELRPDCEDVFNVKWKSLNNEKRNLIKAFRKMVDDFYDAICEMLRFGYKIREFILMENFNDLPGDITFVLIEIDRLEDGARWLCEASDTELFKFFEETMP